MSKKARGTMAQPCRWCGTGIITCWDFCGRCFHDVLPSDIRHAIIVSDGSLASLRAAWAYLNKRQRVRGPALPPRRPYPKEAEG